MNANNRYYRGYEIHGWMKYAFGNDTRFVADISYEDRWEELKKYFEESRYLDLPLYNTSNYKPNKPQYKIYVDYGETNISKLPPGGTFKLIGMKIFKPKKFRNVIKGITKMEGIKINDHSSKDTH